MELSKNIYDKQFTTVTTHKNVQNYYNEKCAKYLMLDLKKYRGVTFHDTRVMQNLKKNLLLVWKMT